MKGRNLMKDKKKIAFLSLALTALLALSGCGGNNPSTDPSKNTETTSVDPGTSATESHRKRSTVFCVMSLS